MCRDQLYSLAAGHGPEHGRSGLLGSLGLYIMIPIDSPTLAILYTRIYIYNYWCSVSRVTVVFCGVKGQCILCISESKHILMCTSTASDAVHGSRTMSLLSCPKRKRSMKQLPKWIKAVKFAETGTAWQIYFMTAGLINLSSMYIYLFN